MTVKGPERNLHEQMRLNTSLDPPRPSTAGRKDAWRLINERAGRGVEGERPVARATELADKRPQMGGCSRRAAFSATSRTLLPGNRGFQRCLLSKESTRSKGSRP